MNPEKTMQNASTDQSKKIGRRVGAAMIASVAAGEVPAQDVEPATENSSVYTQEANVKQTQEQYLEISRQKYEQAAREDRAWLIADLKKRQSEGREMTREDQEVSGYNSLTEALNGLEQSIQSEVERKLDLDRQIMDIENAGKAAMEISQTLKTMNDSLSTFVSAFDQATPSSEKQHNNQENPAIENDQEAINKKMEDIQNL